MGVVAAAVRLLRLAAPIVLALTPRGEVVHQALKVVGAKAIGGVPIVPTATDAATDEAGHDVETKARLGQEVATIPSATVLVPRRQGRVGTSRLTREVARPLP